MEDDMKMVYAVVDERYYGGDNVKVFNTREKAVKYIEENQVKYDMTIIEGEVESKNTKVYVTLTEKWWGLPCKFYSTELEAKRRIEQDILLDIIFLELELL